MYNHVELQIIIYALKNEAEMKNQNTSIRKLHAKRQNK